MVPSLALKFGCRFGFVLIFFFFLCCGLWLGITNNSDGGGAHVIASL